MGKISPRFVSRVGRLFVTAVFIGTAFLFWSGGTAQAAVTATSTSLLPAMSYVQGTSTPTAAFQLSIIATDSETLTAINVLAMAASSTAFATSDLATLATSSISGIALYDDSGSATGTFDGTDAVLVASTTPVWSGSPASTTITLKTPPVISSTTPSIFWVSFRTASGLNTQDHQFTMTMATSSIITSTNSPSITTTSTAPILIDAVPPASIAADSFSFMQNSPGTADQITANTSIGLEGDILKVFVNSSSTLIGQGIIGPTGQPAPISIGDNQNASVDLRVFDLAQNTNATITKTGNDITLPTVTTSTAFTDRIIINFSENVDGMAAMNCSNYTVNGSVLSCSGPGTPFIDFQGNKATIKGLSLSGTATLAIAGGVIKDINGANNPLAAYSSGSLAVNALSLPTITNISPTSGAVGASVTITGTNFGTGIAGDDNHKVFFSGGFDPNTGPLPSVEADYTGASWSANSIAVKVPSGAKGGPVNIMVSGVMSDMGDKSFFDVKGNYTAKVYYSATSTTPMPDGDVNNIRIIAAGPTGPAVHYVGDGAMTYSTSTDTFTITNVDSMGWVWAYDVTGAHLNAPGRQTSIITTQDLNLLPTTRKVSGTITLGTSCATAGQDRAVVVFAMPDQVNEGDSGFKQIEPSFFVTGPTNGQTACQTTYSVGIPINGVYRVEAHIPPDMSTTTVSSAPFVDPSAQSITISNSTTTVSNVNFAFNSATHRIVGTVQKPSGGFGTDERNMLWVFAYQPKEGGKGTATQVGSDNKFTLYVTTGIWKVGVSGENMPTPVETQVDVDDTYEIGDPAKGPTIIIAPPSDFIEGYVKDAAGNGLTDASIYAWREGGPGGGNAKTDSQGYYKMYVTPGTSYHVGAHSQSYGFLGEQSGITVSGSSHPTINFTVVSGNVYTISGTVTKGGVALQQAFVFVTEGERGRMLGSAGTDSSGAYSLKVSGGSSRWLHVGLPGKGEVYVENLGTVSANNTSKNIAITASTITVRISPKSSFSQAFVGVHSDSGGGFSDTDVSASGATYREYQIDVSRPGSGSTAYYVDGGIPGYGPLPSISVAVDSSGNFTETSGGTANDGIIEITLSGLYTVSGVVTGSSTDAWVWAASPSAGGGGGQVNASGTFSFKLKNGTYDLGVGKPGYIGNKVSITINGADLPDQSLTLTQAASTITGKVYLSDGVTTATDAKVWAGNGSGGWAGGSTDANGAYTLNVTSGTWLVQAAYDGYSTPAVTTASSGASNVNITLTAISGFASNLKNAPVTPANGGIVQGTGIKVDFPKNALGTDSSAGTVEVKSTTNVPSVSTTKTIGTAKEITARNSSNQTITTLSGSITIELTVSKSEIQAQSLSFSQVQNMRISYWDSTANNWVEIPTTVTLHPSTATSVSGLDSDPAVTLSGTVSHLSAFAPTVSTDNDLTTPTGLAASGASSSQINLSWTAASGATGYNVYRSISANASFGRVGSEPTVSGGSTVSYSDTGLAAGGTYYYKVSAVSASGESAASSYVSAATSGGQASPGGGGSTGGTAAPATTTPILTSTSTSTSTSTVAVQPISSAGPVTIPLLSAEPTSAELQSVLGAIVQQMAYIKANLTAVNVKTLLLDVVKRLGELQAAIKPGVGVPAGGLSRAISVGAKGVEVKILQQFLSSQGIDIYPEGTVSGYFGPLTKAAVGRFQIKYGIVKDANDSGYGLVGPKTRAKINSLLIP